MPEGRRTARRTATNAKAAKAKRILSKPAPKPETPPDEEADESEEEGCRWYVYESAEEGEEESSAEEEEEGEAEDELREEDDEEPQVVDLASDKEEGSEGGSREVQGKRKRVRTVVSDGEDDDVGPAAAAGPQSSHAAAPKKSVSTARASPAKQAAVKPDVQSPSKKRKDDGKVAVKQEPAAAKAKAASRQAAKSAPPAAVLNARSSKPRSKKGKQQLEEADPVAADDNVAEGDSVTDTPNGADETGGATEEGDKQDDGAAKAALPAPEVQARLTDLRFTLTRVGKPLSHATRQLRAPRTPLRPTPKLKVRSPVMGGSDGGYARRPTEGVLYEAEFTYHDHGLESLKFKEIVDGNVKLIHTGYKRQEGTITDALTDKMGDASRRREKVQARTSGPPRWEDSSDRDSWIFIRFVPVEDVTKEFVDSE
eukprot:3932155-Rhodomonas_salina.1